MRLEPKMPVEDVNDRRRLLRRVTALVLGGAAVLLLLAVVAGSVAAHRVPAACNGCHAPRIRETHAASAHADVRCVECHQGCTGMLGLAGAAHIAEGLLHLSSASHSTVGRVTDDSCLGCHPGTPAQEAAVSKGVRMSHAGLSEGGYRCIDCHEELVHGATPGKMRVPTMSMCIECHDGITASATCIACHPERSGEEGERLRDQEFAQTHGANWKVSHGLGDLTTCGVCHQPEKCLGCHDVELPHPADFGLTHGPTAVESDTEACVRCHTQAFCTSCHGMPMPHPDGFLARHSTEAASRTDKRCLVCHTSTNCDECHIQHTHPGIKHRLRPPTGMYKEGMK